MTAMGGVTQRERQRRITISDILLRSDSQHGCASTITLAPSIDAVSFQCMSKLLLSVALGIRNHKFFHFLTHFLYHSA